jgi:aminopeptidase
MTDKRWLQLADILVNYSTKVTPGDRVQIAMVEVETLPLAQAVYTEAIKAGALPQVQFLSAYFERALMLHGSSDQLEWVPDQEAHGMEWADVYIGLRRARNPTSLRRSLPKPGRAERAMGKVSALRNQTRWVLVRVPNRYALAQQAHMSLEEMMEFFFSAVLQDWQNRPNATRNLRPTSRPPPGPS